MGDSLYHIMQGLSADFIDTVTDCDSVAELNTMIAAETDLNKIAVLQARIDNINYLVS